MTSSDEDNYSKPNKRRRETRATQSQQIPSTSKRSISSNPPSKDIKRQKLTSESDSEDDVAFRESSAGVVKKLILTNFMCHQHYTISLNPRINFICGANGSGKSAIQTGLVIGLGGVASKTNRSSKLNGLIKHGCNAGSISVFLSYYGDNAYKPEEYRNTIQIIRNITTTSSSYRVLNQFGKVMSQSKKEVDNVIMKFRINVNNPVTVLNQDSARNFLTSSKAENKYALFRKATHLEESEELLTQLNNQLIEQSQLIRNTLKKIDALESDILLIFGE